MGRRRTTTVLLGAVALLTTVTVPAGADDPPEAASRAQAAPGALAGPHEELAAPTDRTPEPAPSPFTGTIVSPGTQQFGASAWHAAGLRGAGVRVGIVSDGFALWSQAQAAGDVPAPAGDAPTCDSTLLGLNLQGTFVAEVVADVAPQATLYRLCADSRPAVDGTTPTLAQAVEWAIGQGVDVIVSTVEYTSTGRGDGSGAAGTPEAIAASAVARGVLWISTVGDGFASHWHGTFGGGGNRFHDFPGGAEDLYFHAFAGEYVTVSMKWDSWPSTTEDYDLIVRQFDSGGTGSNFRVSTTDQAAGGAPRESVGFNVTTTGWYSARIDGFAISGARPRIDLTVDSVIDTLPPTFHPTRSAATLARTGSSIVEPATSPSVLAVAGWCMTSPDLATLLSSEGPTIDGRNPHVAAPAGVLGAHVFGVECDHADATGVTGAAHVAGAAALLLQRDPSASPATLRARLAAYVDDVGPVGTDTSTGAGVLTLTPAPSPLAVVLPAEIEITPPGGDAVIPLAASGTDGYPATFAVASGPSHGTVQIGGGNAVYTANPGTERQPDAFSLVAVAGGVQSPAATVSVGACRDGYHLIDESGQVESFGCVAPLSAAGEGAPTGRDGRPLPVAGFAARPQGDGYWVAYPNGKVVGVNAPVRSNAETFIEAFGEVVVGIQSTNDGEGYWLVTDRGHVYAYGAPHWGDVGTGLLTAPVIDMAPTRDNRGYWLFAADGGIFAYGAAPFYGSTGDIRLNRPVVGMAATPTGGGYWMVASDGGVFAFGDAPFHGSLPEYVPNPNSPVFAMALSLTNAGQGYYMFGEDGGTFAFGDARFVGSAAGRFRARGVGAVTAR